MVGRALPDRVKRAKQRNFRDHQLRKALVADEANRLRPKHLQQSRADIAREFKVNKDTLKRLADGGTSISAFNAGKQKLTPVEERIVVNDIKESADRGFPLVHSRVVAHANSIISARPTGHTLKDLIKPTSNWMDRFLIRHHDELQTHWSKPLDSKRGQALNPTAVHDWFHNIVKPVLDQGIEARDIYAMDETGNTPGDERCERVIGRKGTNTQHKQGGADRENITTLVTVCADGSVLKPCVIFKGKNFQKRWAEGNVANASLAVSENGWTDGELGVEYIKDFNKQTEAKAEGRTRVLIVDGHNSHYTVDFLTYAREHNIIVLAYPPHCTHALQGLDVVLFAILKRYYREEVSDFEMKNKRNVTKADFTGVWGRAFIRAFTKDNILSAFRVTGIHPFDPSVITPEQMKPSEATSTTALFTTVLPSPVRAIISALRKNPPTTRDVDPITHDGPRSEHSVAGSSSSSHFHGQPFRSPLATASPVSGLSIPRRRSHIELEDDDVDDTPSKRTRIITANLASTSSGSFLLSKRTVTSHDVLPAPILQTVTALPDIDWSVLQLANCPSPTSSTEELHTFIATLLSTVRLAHQHIKARDEIIEGNNAQMVLQALHLKRQNEALYAKETKKDADRTKVFVDGKGRWLTDTEFMEALQVDGEKRRAEVAAKEGRKEERVRKKSMKEEMEAAWKAAKEEHDRAVGKWTSDCAELLQRGVLKKDLPKRPQLRKADVVGPIQAAYAKELEDGSSASESDSEPDDE